MCEVCQGDTRRAVCQDCGLEVWAARLGNHQRNHCPKLKCAGCGVEQGCDQAGRFSLSVRGQICGPCWVKLRAGVLP
jgi:hypothetical protein